MAQTAGPSAGHHEKTRKTTTRPGALSGPTPTAHSLDGPDCGQRKALPHRPPWTSSPPFFRARLAAENSSFSPALPDLKRHTRRKPTARTGHRAGLAYLLGIFRGDGSRAGAKRRRRTQTRRRRTRSGQFFPESTPKPSEFRRAGSACLHLTYYSPRNFQVQTKFDHDGSADWCQPWPGMGHWTRMCASGRFQRIHLTKRPRPR